MAVPWSLWERLWWLFSLRRCGCPRRTRWPSLTPVTWIWASKLYHTMLVCVVSDLQCESRVSLPVVPNYRIIGPDHRTGGFGPCRFRRGPERIRGCTPSPNRSGPLILRADSSLHRLDAATGGPRLLPPGQRTLAFPFAACFYRETYPGST